MPLLRMSSALRGRCAHVGDRLAAPLPVQLQGVANAIRTGNAAAAMNLLRVAAAQSPLGLGVIVNNNMTAAALAAVAGDTEMALQFVNAGVPVGAHADVFLEAFVRNGEPHDIAQAAAAVHADEATLSEALAVAHDHAAFRALIDLGANPLYRNPLGWTTLVTALARRGWPAAQILYDMGVPVDARTNGGQTALMLMAGENMSDRVRWLLDHGASTTLRDDAGRTAETTAWEANAHAAALELQRARRQRK